MLLRIRSKLRKSGAYWGQWLKASCIGPALSKFRPSVGDGATNYAYVFDTVSRVKIFVEGRGGSRLHRFENLTLVFYSGHQKLTKYTNPPHPDLQCLLNNSVDNRVSHKSPCASLRLSPVNFSCVCVNFLFQQKNHL